MGGALCENHYPDLKIIETEINKIFLPDKLAPIFTTRGTLPNISNKLTKLKSTNEIKQYLSDNINFKDKDHKIKCAIIITKIIKQISLNLFSKKQTEESFLNKKVNYAKALKLIQSDQCLPHIITRCTYS